MRLLMGFYWNWFGITSLILSKGGGLIVNQRVVHQPVV